MSHPALLKKIHVARLKVKYLKLTRQCHKIKTIIIPSLQIPLAEQSLGQTSFPIISTTEPSSVSFLM